MYILVGFNHLDMVIYCPYDGLGWCFFSNLQSGNYIAEPFITSIYLNLVIISDYNQSYRKHLLSSQFPSLYCVLYKTSKLVRLMKLSLTVC